MKNDISCPECGKNLKVWIDLNFSVEFKISKSGILHKPQPEGDLNGEGRCGVTCTSCDFNLHSFDDTDNKYTEIIEKAYDNYANYELKLRKIINKI